MSKNKTVIYKCDIEPEERIKIKSINAAYTHSNGIPEVNFIVSIMGASGIQGKIVLNEEDAKHLQYFIADEITDKLLGIK